jgi:ferredoxin
MTVTITIDADACVGYGECVNQEAEAVELDRSGCARVLVAELDPDRAKRLCASCPSGAITLAA